MSFLTPLALWGLLALPVIWWLLRFTPPRPQTIQFPPLRILLSLKSKNITPDRTPWWLLLLRLALAAALILAVAHPSTRLSQQLKLNNGPLLLVVDDGWAAAANWDARLAALSNIIDDAREANRTVILATTTQTLSPKSFTEMSAAGAKSQLLAMQPQALKTDRIDLIAQIRSKNVKASSVTWLADGIDVGSSKQFKAELQKLFGEDITSLKIEKPLIALAKPKIENSEIIITALRNLSAPNTATALAIARNGRILHETQINFGANLTSTSTISLPIELRNQIQSISIKNENHAGAKQLLDDRWRLRTIALQSGNATESVQQLLSPLHYVKSALTPYAELHEPANAADLKSEIDAGLSLLLLADIGKLAPESHDTIAAWIEKGGVLLRFAGPRMAAGTDDLMPVELRQGDRNLGSALSWETPQTLQPFPEKSPFNGLKIGTDITVSQQLLAEPDVSLNEKTWASLSDGTPLVTAKKQGKGLIILFHITANADWSNLALSGTFVEMLQRIVELAPAAGSNSNSKASDLTRSVYSPRLLMLGTGEMISPKATQQSIKASEMDSMIASSQNPVGLYESGNQERSINLDLKEADLTPIIDENLLKVEPAKTTNFAPHLFGLAAILFLGDCFAAIFLRGGFNRKSKFSAILIFYAVSTFLQPTDARAGEQNEMAAALQTHLAYVKTGDAEIDLTSQQGLHGLTFVVSDRTSATLGEPVGLDLETDDLVFYPLIYWPLTQSDQSPSDAVLAKLAKYTRSGGTFFFDLRDITGEFDGSSEATQALKRILEKLDVPPLETVPENHALTRSFYLLKTFPGRYETGALWLEAQNTDGTASTSDGVSGFIIGSNDYAAAWAIDAQGQALNAMIPGSDRQREMAFRVGVNIVMYVLTGNYKTDQVHIPALLKRIGE